MIKLVELGIIAYNGGLEVQVKQSMQVRCTTVEDG